MSNDGGIIRAIFSLFIGTIVFLTFDPVISSQLATYIAAAPASNRGILLALRAIVELHIDVLMLWFGTIWSLKGSRSYV